MPIPKILREMLTLPTAPFVESAVLDFIRARVAAIPAAVIRADRWGNLLVHLRGKKRPGNKLSRKSTPLVFTAHTDHPGFCALEMTAPKRLRAAFRGWVEPEYFLGTGVRFWTGAGWVRGKIRKVTRTAKVYRLIGRTARPEEVEVAIDGPVPVGAAGMWDLPDPFEKDGCVYARGCDDIAGCAAMIALLERLSRKTRPPEVYCLFTRAEEIGFVGAIGAAKSRTIPIRLPVIAIETSKALTNAKIGDGPILRVGDKSSIFTPEVTDFCNRVGLDLAEKRKSFAFQRKLMDGGTCESTAYYAYGYAATGMCVALGNYHNMNTQTKKIESEYISIADWERLVDYFEALVLATPGYGGESTDRKAGLEKRFAEWRGLL